MTTGSVLGDMQPPAVAPPSMLPTTQPGIPAGLRRFGDSSATRKLIFDNMLQAAQNFEPIANARHNMSLEDAHWAGPERFSIADQKKAILSQGTLARKLMGTYVLRDNEGQEIARRKSQIAQVPYMTDRGTFVMRGNEYTVSHQTRMLPGVFTRKKQNGDYESHINVSKGYGHRVFLDPESGVFRVEMGQAKIPMLPLLKAMGVSDSQLRDAWGNELLAANMKQDSPQAISKLYDKLYNGRKEEGVDKREAVVKAFNEMELDPEVTRRTLGGAYSNAGSDTMMAVTGKLLRVARGEEQPDDRDAMPYQRIIGPEDLFAERFKKAKTLARQLLWKASARGNLDHVPTNAYGDAVKGAILSSGLGMPLEEINSAEVFDQQSRVTRMGEGGIPSLDAVPDECYDDETEVFTSQGWLPWAEADLSTEFACLIDGRMEYHRAYRVLHQIYNGKMYGIRTRTLDCLVTPGHRHWVRKYRSSSSVKRCGEADWGYELAINTHRRPRQFKVSHDPFTGAVGAFRFTLPIVSGARHAFEFDTADWAELVGWYVSEGSIDSYARRKHGKYQITITQDYEANTENVRRIDELLTRMGIAHSYQSKNFVFVSKQLGDWFTQNCGVKCSNKRLPEECFFWSAAARQRLYDGLMLGDGSLRENDSGVYTSKSQSLVDQVARLATTLGIAASSRLQYTRIDKRTDRSDDPRTGCSCGLLISDVQGVTSERMYDNAYYTQSYSGYVHCAEVPGGLLFVRRRKSLGMWSGNSRAVQPSYLGFIDFLRTPESGKVGVDARLARSAMKGPDGKLYTQVRTPTGESVYKTPQDLADATVAFPNELKSDKQMVAALQGGRLRMVPRKEVDFEIPDMESTFSPLGNMIPFKSMVKGQRAVMAARMLTQALPLKNAEAPLVQSGIPGEEGRSFEDEYAKHMGALRADRPGRVLDVSDDRIRVRYDDGSEEDHDLYHNFPFNRKTFLHQMARVQPGDTVAPGQLLAASNFTDADGTAALGLNARVAYTSWRGLNFEDANVVSESFAKRAASEHMYQNQHEWESGDQRGRNAFISIFPAKYDRKMLANFDDSGVIKVGTKVRKDDPLILIARQKERNKKSLLQGGKPSFGDVSQKWEHDHDGVVTDVVHNDKGVAVVVKATMPMQVGDKMSGRYGDKGVISHIIPDDEMPTDKDGKAFDVLLNPLGVISRTNAAQILETALGKIAAARGEPFKIPDFQDEDDLIEFGIKELQKAGMEDLEDIIDPTNGRKINEILTGNRWFMKLHHTSESKAQGRGLGGYTADMSPAKGGDAGAKRIGLLQTNALLSHGATEVLRDAKLVRGQANPEYWTQYMSGFKPPTPKVPMVYHKFVDSLRASGINVVRDGSRMHVMAMTNHDVDQLAGDRELQSVETVDWKTMEPIKGGLFDQKLTGGHHTADGGGNRWSYIKLQAPMPNPAMEEPIRRVLGLTKKQLNEVISGQHKIDGHTGPTGLQQVLENINIDKEIERARLEINSGRKSQRDAAVRRLGYLKSTKRLGIHPKEWMLSKAPVLPPAFRPISTMGPKKLPLVADPNYLYKELWDANQSLKDLSGELSDSDLGDERLAVYNAFKAVTGLGDPTHPKNQERQVKGILKHVFGSSPKLGTVQRRLLSTTTDQVGRSVIAPDPNLDMDQVGVPESKAWTIYRMPLVRRLVKNGMSRVEAARAVEEKSSVARKALLDEMDGGVVVISRDPALHRYSMMAARPRLVKGNVLKISPLVVGGFGADFDGDAMAYHVPSTPEAQEEALEKMLPSRNLLSAADYKVHYSPSQEYVGGLYEASARVNERNKPVVFATVADAVRAYRNGQINTDRKVEILER